MENKTTKEDFELFKEECEYWLDEFGLKDYETFKWHSDEAKQRGACTIDVSGKIGELYLFKDWQDSPRNKKEISKTAFHETCELLIGELVSYANDRFTTEDQIIAASHRIIRVMEKLLFNPYYEVKLEESKG